MTDMIISLCCFRKVKLSDARGMIREDLQDAAFAVEVRTLNLIYDKFNNASNQQHQLLRIISVSISQICPCR